MNRSMKFSLPQDMLKILACMTMLIDHIGAIFFPYIAWIRIVGRISFPLYAFLLAEGVHHTRNLKKYGLRLLLILVLTELPYDLLFRGTLTWTKNSAMVTLFLGFCIGTVGTKLPFWGKCLAVIPFAFLARYTHGSYGMNGVLMIAIFLLTRELPYRVVIQSVLMVLLSLRISGYPGDLSIQIWAIAALIPIWLYSGQKRSSSRFFSGVSPSSTRFICFCSC